MALSKVRVSLFGPANATPDQTTRVNDIEALDASIREKYARQWTQEAQQISRRDSGIPIRTASFERTQPMPQSPNEFVVLGDFREGDFDGWFTDGEAFGEAPPTGQIRFDETGTLAALKSPRATSNRVSSRLIGALRSPTFTIEKPYVTVKAAGKEAHARVVIDNFQLIRHPIYGGLEFEIDAPDMRFYTFDLRMWKGREAYVEFMPGQYDQHAYVKSDSSFIAAEYAVAHDEARIEEDLKRWTTGSTSSLTEAIDAWRRNQASTVEVALLAEAVRAGRLSREIEGVEALLERRKEQAAALDRPTVFMGMVEGNGKDQPVFYPGKCPKPE